MTPIELPPPPANPVLPPEVRIADERELSFTTTDGVTIEALGYLPPSAVRVVVLCHPHPLYGATMHNALVVVTAKRLREQGDTRVGFLRFNFRGVGRSGGRHEKGIGEVNDALAALAEARRAVPSAKQSIVGISFGTGAAYRAAIADPNVERVSLVTPSPRFVPATPSDLSGLVQVVAAGNDELAIPEETRDIADRLGAILTEIPGADHQFIRFRRELAAIVAPFAAPELLA